MNGDHLNTFHAHMRLNVLLYMFVQVSPFHFDVNGFVFRQRKKCIARSLAYRSPAAERSAEPAQSPSVINFLVSASHANEMTREKRELGVAETTEKDQKAIYCQQSGARSAQQRSSSRHLILKQVT